MSGTDFNDMALGAGKDAVRAAIDNAFEPPSVAGGTDDTGGTEPVQAGCAVPPVAAPHGTDGTVANSIARASVPESDRPCWKVYDEWTLMDESGVRMRPGVYWHTMTRGTKSEPSAPIEAWVCAPLHMIAQTADAAGNAYGRLLRFKTSRGQWRDWAMPMHLLKGDGTELRGELLEMGLLIDQDRRALLSKYLLSKEPTRWMQCATSLGWCGKAYVFPSEVIGADDIVFQHDARIGDECTAKGSLEAWRAEVAAYAIGNPILAVCLSVAFAGPLLLPCDAESGGIHLQGNSSCGKTTALCVGTSVWGGPDYRRSWRATANGLEGAAALHNDGLLALDEISECDPREVGAVVYMIGNGHGKQRASRTGAARVATRWRCSILSTGEATIGAAMAEVGQQQKAGQLVRLLDVQSQRAHGIYDKLGTFTSGAALSDHLKRMSASHYGHAAREFVRRLASDATNHAEALDHVRASGPFNVPGLDQQEVRAASRFALFAYAGELATHYGITGWPPGTATAAAAELFREWRAWRGTGRSEHRQILDAVKDFIERHGDSRFASFSGGDPVVIRDRAGWIRLEDGLRLYLFTAGGLREALKGHDFKAALDVLEAAGALAKAPASGERRRSYRIDSDVLKLYPINAVALQESLR